MTLNDALRTSGLEGAVRTSYLGQRACGPRTLIMCSETSCAARQTLLGFINININGLRCPSGHEWASQKKREVPANNMYILGPRSEPSPHDHDRSQKELRKGFFNVRYEGELVVREPCTKTLYNFDW